MIGEFHYFCLSAVLFTVGIFGVLINKKSVINLLIAVELMLLATNINFISSSSLHGVEGHVFSIMILTVAAAEASVGLAILIAYFRNAKNIEILKMNRLKG